MISVGDRSGEHLSAIRVVMLALSFYLCAVHAQGQTTAYRVYFDWDKATLSNQAHQTIQEAAYAARASSARVIVTGFTDTSGTVLYNQSLSLRRAQIVAAELEHNSVPQTAIGIQANGGYYLVTPTSLNVREPRNRAVGHLQQRRLLTDNAH